MENPQRKPNGPYKLVNITEELVKDKVLKLMPSQDMCSCEKCFYDVCAIALNTLKPRYVTTQTGSLLSMLSALQTESQADLTVGVLQALIKVKQQPKH